MITRTFKVASALLLAGTAAAGIPGCAYHRCHTAEGPCGERRHVLASWFPCYKSGCHTTTVKATETTASTDLPRNAAPGECYAKVWIPPETKTVTERVCVKEASERVEIIPATYEWVDEKVCVKEAYKEMVDIPAQYEWVEQTVVTDASHTDWVREDGRGCKNPNGGQLSGDVFCLVNFPEVTKTVKVQKLVKPASCQSIDHPAEYQTVRRQKLACAAQTKRIPIPAEFDTVQRTVTVGCGHMEWQKVQCDLVHRENQSASTYDQVKRALSAAGYNVSSTPGVMTADDWDAVRKFQRDNDLAVGPLTVETINKLGVQNVNSNQYMLTKSK
jgi:hypothetical protein